jgi:hypothetical protein
MSTARGSVCFVALAALVITQWPQPAAAFHIVGFSVTVTSFDSIAGQVDIDIIETTTGSGTPHSGAFVQWGDGMSSFQAWTSTTGAAPKVYKRSTSHTYPDLTTRMITATGDTNIPSPFQDTAQVDFECADTPAVGCHVGPKSQLKIKNNSVDDAKDKFIWKWQKGDTSLEQLGDPTADTQYYVCVYAPGLVFDAIVPNGPPWAAAGSKGFKYKDVGGAAGGVTKMKLKSGAVDKAKILVKGKGMNLDDPLPLTQPVLVQLRANNGECWEHQFSSPEKKSSGDQFKDKEP